MPLQRSFLYTGTRAQKKRRPRLAGGVLVELDCCRWGLLCVNDRLQQSGRLLDSANVSGRNKQLLKPEGIDHNQPGRWGLRWLPPRLCFASFVCRWGLGLLGLLCFAFRPWCIAFGANLCRRWNDLVASRADSLASSGFHGFNCNCWGRGFFFDNLNLPGLSLCLCHFLFSSGGFGPTRNLTTAGNGNQMSFGQFDFGNELVLILRLRSVGPLAALGMVPINQNQFDKRRWAA